MTTALPNFSMNYMGQNFFIVFAQHANGVAIEVYLDIDHYPPMADGVFYPDYDSAKASGIQQTQRLIDRMIENS